MSFTLGFITGIIIGWNFFAQPQWVKVLVDKGVTKIQNLVGSVVSKIKQKIGL